MNRATILCLTAFSIGLLTCEVVFGQNDGSRAPGAGRTGSRSVKLNGSSTPSRATRISTGSRNTDRGSVNLSSLSRDAAKIRSFEGKMQRHHDDLQKFASENGIQLDVIRDNKQNNEIVQRLLRSQETLKDSGNAAKATAIETILDKINEMRGLKSEKLENAKDHWQTKKANAQDHWQTKKANAQDHWQTKKANAQDHWQNKKANVQDHWQTKKTDAQATAQGQNHAGQARPGQSRSMNLSKAKPRSGNSTRIQASDRSGSPASKKSTAKKTTTQRTKARSARLGSR